MSFGGSIAKAKVTPALPHEEGIDVDDEDGSIFNRMLGRVRRVTGVSRGEYEMVGLEAREDAG